MAITAASTTALALLEASGRSMPVHSTFRSGVNLRCGDHLIYLSTRPLGGVASLRVTTNDVDVLRGQQSWDWLADTLVGGDGRTVIGKADALVQYSTSQPPPVILSSGTPHRLAHSLARTGHASWFDTGVGLRLGRPRLRKAIRSLVRREPDAAEGLSAVVGLGAGLTPSADDALVGALCVLSAQRTQSGALREQMLGWLSAEGAVATTDVSLSYLRLAFDGAFSAPITHVVGCLADEFSQDDLDEAVRALSALGAASGMDTALGIELACEYLN